MIDSDSILTLLEQGLELNPRIRSNRTHYWVDFGSFEIYGYYKHDYFTIKYFRVKKKFWYKTFRFDQFLYFNGCNKFLSAIRNYHMQELADKQNKIRERDAKLAEMLQKLLEEALKSK